MKKVLKMAMSIDDIKKAGNTVKRRAFQVVTGAFPVRDMLTRRGVDLTPGITGENGPLQR